MNNKVEQLIDNIEHVIIGKRPVIEKVVCAMLAGGHVLIEDVPGVGKTLLAETLAKSVSGSFGRIQFTPDLMPSDVVGYTAVDMNSGRNEYRPGAAMCNFLLADEINRSSPKVQSALLEAMEELQISVDGKTYKLPVPFMTLATQNPIETYGTYHLPEAQLDRFLFKINVNRTPADVLTRIVLNREMGVEPEISPVLNAQELLELMQMARNVAIPEVVADYIGRLVNATHPGESEASGGVKYGASPRAALGLAVAAKARALRHGRAFCSFEDVQAVIHPVLEHRILLNHTARLDGQTPAAVINRLVREIPAQNKPLPDSLAAAKIH